MAVVLIVEDEEPLRVLAESIIQDRGHTSIKGKNSTFTSPIPTSSQPGAGPHFAASSASGACRRVGRLNEGSRPHLRRLRP